MRKIIAIIIALLLITSMAEADLYYRFGNIVDIEYDTDFITFDDGMGNLWDGYNPYVAMHCFYYDLIVAIMDDNGTPDWIYDDIVCNMYPCADPTPYLKNGKYLKNNY